MKRVAVLIFCLVAASLASAPLEFGDVIYYELSAGAIYSVSDYKTKSKTNYYHDLEKDEMVYDKDLYYNIYSYEGLDPQLDSKIGVHFFKRVALFLSFGCFWTSGEHRYKLYSRDKEEFSEEDVRFRPYWGFGLKWFPIVDDKNPFNGIFIGTTLRGVFLSGNEEAWEKYGMFYENGETILEVDVGKVWKVSEHYSVGFSVKVAGGFAGNTEKVEGFRVDRHLEQDEDDITLNGKHIGAAITVIRR